MEDLATKMRYTKQTKLGAFWSRHPSMSTSGSMNISFYTYIYNIYI